MAQFLTGDAARERFSALLDRAEAAYREMAELPSDEVGNHYRTQIAEHLEIQHRLNRALTYRIFGQIADPPDGTAPAPAIKQRLAARLRIPVHEVTRRFKTGTRLLPRRQLTGPPLPPEMSAAADALTRGTLGEDHLKAIITVLDKLPSAISITDRDDVESALVRESHSHDADFITELGKGIDALFNPDGHYDEHDRARRRGLRLGPQGPDGMSTLSGHIDPETRAYLEALTAAVRPGRHHPVGTVTDMPDDRTPAQRCHDGLKLGLKIALASNQMGSHRGHPVTVIVRTTLAELNQAAHAASNPDVSMPAPARTGGNTALPMRDLIRMATDAIHYLAIFDEHTGRPLYLGRQTRIATTDHRIICYARDGGCTRPDCTAPGYHCEVHQTPDWHPHGRTDADTLYFACAPDHKLLTDGCWQATPTTTGRLAWTDGTQPPRTNRFHHPDELLRGDPDPPN